MAEGARDTVVAGVEQTLADPLDGDPRLAAYFGDAWPTVSSYAALLRAHGATRGLLGPNEPARLWERHLMNSAGGAVLFPASGTFVDLGSGAGLPGVVLAAMRPAAQVVLLEPMERRTDWLRFVVDELDLANVQVLRGRAEDVVGAVTADVLTARAVSALDKLYRWAGPLVRPGGELFAIKGARAREEVQAARRAARVAGWAETEVVEATTLSGIEPTWVVRAVRMGGGRGVR